MVKKNTENEQKLYCSFCGKEQKEVRKLIAGPAVYICDECIQLCSEIIEEEDREIKSESIFNFDSDDIFSALDVHSHLQKKNKHELVSAIKLHFKRLSIKAKKNTPPLTRKNNILITGPTGIGKRDLCKTITEVINTPYVQTKSTTFMSLSNIEEQNPFEILLSEADYELNKAQKGIIYIDNIERIAYSNHQSEKKDIQIKLVNIFEGTILKCVPRGSNRNNSVEFDTTDVLFICGGSFDFLEEIATKIHIPPQYPLLPSHLIKYGFLQEFANCFHTIIQMDQLTEVDLINFLSNSDKSPILEYKMLFERDKIELNFTKCAIRAIAKEAFTRNAGLLGLRSILENLSLDICLDISSLENDRKIVIDEKLIRERFSI